MTPTDIIEIGAKAAHAAYRAECAGEKLHTPDVCQCKDGHWFESGSFMCSRCRGHINHAQAKSCGGCRPNLRDWDALTEAARESFRAQARPVVEAFMSEYKKTYPEVQSLLERGFYDFNSLRTRVAELEAQVAAVTGERVKAQAREGAALEIIAEVQTAIHNDDEDAVAVVDVVDTILAKKIEPLADTIFDTLTRAEEDRDEARLQRDEARAEAERERDARLKAQAEAAAMRNAVVNATHHGYSTDHPHARWGAGIECPCGGRTDDGEHEHVEHATGCALATDAGRPFLALLDAAERWKRARTEHQPRSGDSCAALDEAERALEGAVAEIRGGGK